MKISIYTPSGLEHEQDADYLMVMDKINGSFGLLNGHMPLISAISNGYIILRLNDKETYIALVGAVLKNEDDIVSVSAEIIAIGDTLEESETALSSLLALRKNQNKARNVELALAENELKKEIKKTGAGHL